MKLLEGHLPILQHAATIRYAIDPILNLIYEEWTGEVTKEDLAEHWTHFLQNKEVVRCRRTVVDLTLASMAFRGDDVHRLIESLVVPVLAGRKWITAIIVSSDFQVGISRQYGAYADFYSKEQIFRKPEDALLWIKDKYPD